MARFVPASLTQAALEAVVGGLPPSVLSEILGALQDTLVALKDDAETSLTRLLASSSTAELERHRSALDLALAARKHDVLRRAVRLSPAARAVVTEKLDALLLVYTAASRALVA